MFRLLTDFSVMAKQISQQIEAIKKGELEKVNEIKNEIQKAISHLIYLDGKRFVEVIELYQKGFHEEISKDELELMKALKELKALEK